MIAERREKPAEPPVVELVDPSYQPSKVERGEEIDFGKVVEGKSLEELARAVLRPVKVRYIKRPAG